MIPASSFATNPQRRRDRCEQQLQCNFTPLQALQCDRKKSQLKPHRNYWALHLTYLLLLEQELLFTEICTQLHSKPANGRGTRTSTGWILPIMSVRTITATLALEVYEKYLAVKTLQWKTNCVNQLPPNLMDMPQKGAQFIGKEALNQLPARCKQEQGHLAEGIFLFMLMSEYFVRQRKMKTWLSPMW